VRFDLRFERLIAAPPERVFAAFTAPEGQREFYGKDTPGWIVESDCDLRVGGIWSIAFGPSRAQLYHHRHEFRAIEPPRRILMTTTETRLNGSSFEITTEFAFEPHAGGTRMTMVRPASRPRSCATSTRSAYRTASTGSSAASTTTTSTDYRTSLDRRTLMTPARLIPQPNGPYEVTGPLELLDPDGEPIKPSAEQVYLCRCGRSAKKPFCDGSHARTGWTEQDA
jgi:uncharacterized protein YndB with AHSA1/START domain/CDGSH-type Zn-finger protein